MNPLVIVLGLGLVALGLWSLWSGRVTLRVSLIMRKEYGRKDTPGPYWGFVAFYLIGGAFLVYSGATGLF